MQKLIQGVCHFRERTFRPLRELFARLSEGQHPEALCITCADSRIDPESITQSGPGEIFVCRNVGNLVPAYGEALGGVSAIVEYAVSALRVSHAVVCGHTDCGAMIGLLHPERVQGLPTVQSWLRHGEAALSIVRRRKPSADERSQLDELIEENVLQQMHHLRTHPSVAGALAEGALALSGWVFDIGHGAVRIYDEERRQFLPVTSEAPASSRATS